MDDILNHDPDIRGVMNQSRGSKLKPEIQEFVFLSTPGPAKNNRRQCGERRRIEIKIPTIDGSNIDEVEAMKSHLTIMIRRKGTRASEQQLTLTYSCDHCRNEMREMKEVVYEKFSINGRNSHDKPFVIDLFKAKGTEKSKAQKWLEGAIKAGANTVYLDVEHKTYRTFCIENMWAVVKYQISRVQRSRRTTETDILADNNHSCGLRKLEIDFTDDYYHRFRHIIKQPETYDYYYCAGRCLPDHDNINHYIEDGHNHNHKEIVTKF